MVNLIFFTLILIVIAVVILKVHTIMFFRVESWGEPVPFRRLKQVWCRLFGHRHQYDDCTLTHDMEPWVRSWCDRCGEDWGYL